MPIPGTEQLSPEFFLKVNRLATDLGTDPEHLLSVMSFETGGTFAPAGRNHAGSGATGLLQFLPATARSLGTSTDALAKMTPEGQLDYVGQYLRPYKGKLGSLKDTYMAVLYPAAVGKPEWYGLFREGQKAYAQNRGLDTEGKGRVTVGDAVRTVRAFVGSLGSPRSAAAAEPREDRLQELLHAVSQPQQPPARTPELLQAVGSTREPEAPMAESSFSPLAEQEAAATQQALYGASPAPGASAPAVQRTPAGGIDYSAYLPGPNAVPGADVARMGAAVGQSVVGTASGAALGARLGGLAGPVGSAVGGVLGGIAGSYLARRANVESGLEAEGVGGDVLSVAVPAVPGALALRRPIGGALARGSHAGKAITAADEATGAAQRAYQDEVATYGERQAQEIATRRAQEAERLAGVQQRRAVAEERHVATESRREAAVAHRQAQAAREAEALTTQQAQEYTTQVQRYEQAVASQQRGVTQARAIPPRYTPETPSHLVYRNVAEIAPEAPVTLMRTQEVAADLQDVLSQVPALQPSRLQRLLTDVRAARSTESVREVQRYLTDLGALTRSPDSATRRTARQLYGALHEDLAESASRLPETDAARALLLRANATFRREMAIRDLSGVIRRGITVGDDGIPRLAPGRVLTQFDRLVEGDRLFAGSFTPEELTQLRGELAGLTGVERIPSRPGPAPPPVPPRAVAPYTSRPFQEPGIPAGQRVRPQTMGVPQPGAARPQPPEPAVPVLPEREVKALQRLLRAAGVLDFVIGGPGVGTAMAVGREGLGQVSDLLAQMLLTPRWQPYVRSLMQADGTINRQALIALAGGRAALQAEREKR